MSLTEEPYYMKHDCSPMCNHQEECVRCHNPHCIKYMYHSRLHGYTCTCGSQEWKPVFEFSKQRSGLTKDAADFRKARGALQIEGLDAVEEIRKLRGG